MTLIAKALDEYAQVRPTKFDADERMNTVGASEIGQCIRKTYWLKNEDNPPIAVARDPEYQDSWGARQRGTVFEDRFWVPAMRAKFGKRLKYAGRYQKTFQHGFLSATPDALITDLTNEERLQVDLPAVIGRPAAAQNCILAECKTADPRSNLVEAKDVNVFQAHVQLGLVRETTIWKPLVCVISYTDASFWSEVKEFRVVYDREIFQNAQARATKIMTSTSLDEIPPEGWIAGGAECKYCPFTKACGIERRNLPFADDDTPVDPQFAAEIRDMALEIKRLETERDESDAGMRGLQDLLKTRLREKGLRKIPGIVSWSSVKGRSGYDNKQIQAAAVAAGVDIEQYANMGEPSDRLSILIGK